MTFEEFFYRRFLEIQPTTDREYLPVLWSCLYYARHFRADGMTDLQQYLDGLDRSKKYFTVVVYDGGIHEDLKDLDIQVYSAVGHSLSINQKIYCGRLGDRAIPILCRSAPDIDKGRERDVLAGFIGARTHPIRDAMHLILSNASGFSLGRSIINPNMAFLPMDDDKWAKVNYAGFKDLMERSVFALCPRGSSTTSFRVCESLQYGCVPVYISDQYWFPWSDPKNPDDHGVFDKIGITCLPEEIPDLPRRLREVPREKIEEYLENGRGLYQTHFTFEGAFDRIIEELS
jgi:hypothetical protein